MDRRSRFALFQGAMVIALSLWAAETARAQPKSDPDWPCIQRLVPELSYGLLWTGPPLEPYFDTWDDKPERADLVREVTRLSMPTEAAADAVRQYMTNGVAEDEAAILFAGIFQRIAEQRREAIAGIKRYSRGQKALLERIADKLRTLDKLMKQEPKPAEKIETAQGELAATRQVFDARRRALTAVCEQPVLLEQRLGDLQRAIARNR